MPLETLRNLDLNLLLALDALLTERSVTRAAQRTRVTQPAMSQALARLRRAFGDPLLVRSGRGMEPTALALRLSAPLHRLLAQLDDLVRDPGEFAPQTSSRAFQIACRDPFEVLHLPGLVADVQQRAPGVSVFARPLSPDALAIDLERGDVDLGVGVFVGAQAGLMQHTLYEQRSRCLLRRGHPALACWDLDAFLDAPHGLVSAAGRSPGAIDRVLSERHLSRRVAVRIPHVLAAGALIEQTDLIFTLSGRLARWFAQRHDVVCVAPPLALDDDTVAMRWHRRVHEDPAHRWFRERVAQSAR